MRILTDLEKFEKEKKEFELEMYDFSYLSVYFYRKAGSKQFPCGVLKNGVWSHAFSLGGFQPNFEIRARSIRYQKYYGYEFPLKVIYYIKQLSGEYENKLEFLIHENENGNKVDTCIFSIIESSTSMDPNIADIVNEKLWERI